MKESTINHSPEKREFEMTIEGKIAKVNYTLKNETLYLIHSEIPYELRGKGLGKILVEKTFEYIQEHQLKAVPVCSYTKKVARENDKWRDILNGK